MKIRFLSGGYHNASILKRSISLLRLDAMAGPIFAPSTTKKNRFFLSITNVLMITSLSFKIFTFHCCCAFKQRY